MRLLLELGLHMSGEYDGLAVEGIVVGVAPGAVGVFLVFLGPVVVQDDEGVLLGVRLLSFLHAVI